MEKIIEEMSSLLTDSPCMSLGEKSFFEFFLKNNLAMLHGLCNFMACAIPDQG